MKKSYALFLVLLALAEHAFAHEESKDYLVNAADILPLSQLNMLGLVSIGIAVLVIAIVFFSQKMSEAFKKFIYILFAVIVLAGGLYLSITTLYVNLASETKGPVHWHAYYEVWICGQEYKLPLSKSPTSNRQGTPLLHSHEDNKIHVEGALMRKRDGSLGAFFNAVGGYLSADGIGMPTEYGMINFHEGGLCNEKPGKLYVFINGQLNENPPEYVINPYENVPPGDLIKIAFTEKELEEINPYLK